MIIKLTYPRLRNLFTAALFALVFMVQSFAFAHSAQYGEDPHEHESVVCEIINIAPEAQNITPPLIPVSALIYESCKGQNADFISASYITPPGRAPPPRSPPFNV